MVKALILVYLAPRCLLARVLQSRPRWVRVECNGKIVDYPDHLIYTKKLHSGRLNGKEQLILPANRRFKFLELLNESLCTEIILPTSKQVTVVESPLAMAEANSPASLKEYLL